MLSQVRSHGAIRVSASLSSPKENIPNTIPHKVRHTIKSMRVALPRGRRFLAHARLLRPRNQPCASSVGRRSLRTLAPGASVSEDNGYGPHAPPTKWRRKKFNTTFGVRHGKGKRLLKKQMGNRGMAKVRRIGFFPNQSFSRVKTFFAETDPFRFLLPSLRLTSALPPILRLRLDLGIYRSRGIAVTPFPRKREQSERRLFDARGERFSRRFCSFTRRRFEPIN